MSFLFFRIAFFFFLLVFFFFFFVLFVVVPLFGPGGFFFFIVSPEFLFGSYVWGGADLLARSLSAYASTFFLMAFRGVDPHLWRF